MAHIMGNTGLPEACQGMQERQRLFCQQYALTGNGLQSARVAGYNTEHSLSYASILLQSETIQLAIEYYRALYASQTHYDTVKIQQQWAIAAGLNVFDFLTNDYELKPLDELTDDQKKLLGMVASGVKIVKSRYGTTRELQIIDKAKALEHLGRILGAYNDGEGKGSAEGLTINIGIATQVNTGESGGEGIGHIRMMPDTPTED